MPIYLKRRLWRHMSESRMSNFARAIRLWQSVCYFVTRLLMFRQEMMIITSSSPQDTTQKARISSENACPEGRSRVGKHTAHASLLCFQIRKFNSIMHQSQSWVLSGYLTEEDPEWCGVVMLIDRYVKFA